MMIMKIVEWQKRKCVFNKKIEEESAGLVYEIKNIPCDDNASFENDNDRVKISSRDEAFMTTAIE